MVATCPTRDWLLLCCARKHIGNDTHYYRYVSSGLGYEGFFFTNFAILQEFESRGVWSILCISKHLITHRLSCTGSIIVSWYVLYILNVSTTTTVDAFLSDCHHLQSAPAWGTSANSKKRAYYGLSASCTTDYITSNVQVVSLSLIPLTRDAFLSIGSPRGLHTCSPLRCRPSCEPVQCA